MIRRWRPSRESRRPRAVGDGERNRRRRRQRSGRGTPPTADFGTPWAHNTVNQIASPADSDLLPDLGGRTSIDSLTELAPARVIGTSGSGCCHGGASGYGAGMSLLRWLLRPELLVAEAALIGGIAGLGAGLLGALSDPVAGSLRLLGALATGYGTLWILLYAGLSGRREPEGPWATTRAIMWFANAALLLPVFIKLTAPTFFDPGWGGSPPNVLDVPWGLGRVRRRLCRDRQWLDLEQTDLSRRARARG
jgi:hypothetical protein